jgi:hypothetical protein
MIEQLILAILSGGVPQIAFLIVILVLVAFSALACWLGCPESSEHSRTKYHDRERGDQVKLEITPEAYSTICDNLRGAIVAAGQLNGNSPPHQVCILSARIEICLAKCQGELGSIIIEKGDPHVGETRAGVVAGQPGAGSS